MSVHFSNIARAKGDPRILGTGPSSLGAGDRLARGLGWLSLGLGAFELVAPGALAGWLGLWNRQSRLRAFGLREVVTGVLTLSVDKQLGLWSRVGGDALDILTVLPALSRYNPKRGNAALALIALAGVAALDLAAAQSVSARHARGLGPRRSYRDRSGFPKGLESARAVAGSLLDRGRDRVSLL